MLEKINTKNHINHSILDEFNWQEIKLHLFKFIESEPKIHYKLSEAELERAKKYKFTKDKNAYLTRHLAIRDILGDVELTYDENNAPLIKDSDLNISLSNTKKHFAIAVSKNKNFAIDIEYKENKDFVNIAQEFLTSNELDFLKSCKPQKDIFYKFWTAKEAFIKAIKKGLFFDLKDIELEIENDEIKVKNLKNSDFKKEQIKIKHIPNPSLSITLLNII